MTEVSVTALPIKDTTPAKPVPEVVTPPTGEQSKGLHKRQLQRAEKRLDAFGRAQHALVSALAEKKPEEIAHMSADERHKLGTDAMQAIGHTYGRLTTEAIQQRVDKILDREVAIQDWWEGQNLGAENTQVKQQADNALIQKAYARAKLTPKDIPQNVVVERMATGFVMRNVPREMFVDLAVGEIQAQGQTGTTETVTDRQAIVQMLGEQSELGITVDARAFFHDETIPEGTKVILLAEGTPDATEVHERQEVVGREIEDAIIQRQIVQGKAPEPVKPRSIFTRLTAGIRNKFGKSESPDVLKRFATLGERFVPEKIAGVDSVAIQTALHDIAARLSEGNEDFRLGALGLTEADAAAMEDAVKLVKAVGIAVENRLNAAFNDPNVDFSSERQRLTQWIQGAAVNPQRLLQVLQGGAPVDLGKISVDKEDFYGENGKDFVLTPAVENGRFIFHFGSDGLRSVGSVTTIGRQQVTIERWIAHGSFGHTYEGKAKDTTTGKEMKVAVKEETFAQWEAIAYALNDQSHIDTYIQHLFAAGKEDVFADLLDDLTFSIPDGRSVGTNINLGQVSPQIRAGAQALVDAGKTIREALRKEVAVSLRANPGGWRDQDIDALEHGTVEPDANLAQPLVQARNHATEIALRHLITDASVQASVKLLLKDPLRILEEGKELGKVITVEGVPTLRGESLSWIPNPHGGSDLLVYDICMEYFPGITVEGGLSQGYLTVDNVLAVITEACLTLEQANALGIFDGDMGSDNLMYTSRTRNGQTRVGRVKVIDLTTIEQGGKEHYASPEQARGIVNESTQAFSLAVMLYEMLGGDMGKIRSESLHTQNSNIPQNLSDFVDQAIMFDINSRNVKTPHDLREALLHMRFQDAAIDAAFSAIPSNPAIPNLQGVSREVAGYLNLVTNLERSKTFENAFSLLEDLDTSGKIPQYGGLLAATAMRKIMEEDLQIGGPVFTQRRAELVERWWAMLNKAGTGNDRIKIGVFRNADMLAEAEGFFNYINTIITTSTNMYDQQRAIGVLSTLIQNAPHMQNVQLRNDMFLRQVTPRLLLAIDTLGFQGVEISPTMLNAAEVALGQYDPHWLPFGSTDVAHLSPDMTAWFRPVVEYINILASLYRQAATPKEKADIRQRLANFLSSQTPKKSGIEIAMQTYGVARMNADFK